MARCKVEGRRPLGVGAPDSPPVGAALTHSSVSSSSADASSWAHGSRFGETVAIQVCIDLFSAMDASALRRSNSRCFFKAATSAVADAAAREVEKQISAGFGQLMGKRK